MCRQHGPSSLAIPTSPLPSLLSETDQSLMSSGISSSSLCSSSSVSHSTSSLSSASNLRRLTLPGRWDASATRRPEGDGKESGYTELTSRPWKAA